MRSEDMKRNHPAAPVRDCASADFYSCEEAVKRLNEYLDHEMTDEERVVVLKHLEICRPCLRRFTFRADAGRLSAAENSVSPRCVRFLPTLRG